MSAIRHLVIAAIAGLSLSACVQAPGPPGDIKDPWGYPVPEAQAERTIRIGPDTRWVNVTRLETVRFIVDQGGAQKSFAWRFDTLPFRSFTMNDIAPTSVLGLQEVKVYVARNPYLDGGGGRRSSGSRK